jgi:prepilin-type N-terminal cleavage/methylation domain-containing protein
MRSKARTQKGVTLIELLITGVIVGLVATMAVPRFQIAYERLQFRSANRDVISTLKLARSTAISRKVPYGVYFDDSRMTVTLFKDGTTGSYQFDPAADSVVRVDTLPPSFSYLMTDVEGGVFFFRANGSADFNGGGNICMLAYSEDVVALYDSNILASTGRVHSNSYYY